MVQYFTLINKNILCEQKSNLNFLIKYFTCKNLTYTKIVTAKKSISLISLVIKHQIVQKLYILLINSNTV